MNYSKNISIFNGNGKRYTLGIPTLFVPKFGNETARAHFERQTGLKLTPYGDGYKAEPKTFKQLYKVFATYNFKTTYFNNGSTKNTLKLQFNLDN